MRFHQPLGNGPPKAKPLPSCAGLLRPVDWALLEQLRMPLDGGQRRAHLN